MRTQHDNVCLWWKDWHSCSCGYLEEEVRNQKKSNNICLEIVTGTFIMCGEGLDNEKQYCSTSCWEKAKIKNG
jgi:hypothetical protein